MMCTCWYYGKVPCYGVLPARINMGMVYLSAWKHPAVHFHGSIIVPSQPNWMCKQRNTWGWSDISAYSIVASYLPAMRPRRISATESHDNRVIGSRIAPRVQHPYLRSGKSINENFVSLEEFCLRRHKAERMLP